VESVRISAAQTIEFRQDIGAALNYLEDVAVQAETEGAALLCLPECFLQGYLTDDASARLSALELVSPEFDSERLPKAGPMIVMGLIELDRGQLFTRL
jgi:predicted amidohydrolase